LYSLIFRQQHWRVQNADSTDDPTNTNRKGASTNTNVFPAIAASLSICADIFLPLSLSLVPFSVTTTRRAFDFGTYTSILILSCMALQVLWSLIVWPFYSTAGGWSNRLPVDPSTVAGAMWYVLHESDKKNDNDRRGGGGGGDATASSSSLLARLEAEGPLVSMLTREERDARVEAWGATYRYGAVGGGGGDGGNGGAGDVFALERPDAEKKAVRGIRVGIDIAEDNAVHGRWGPGA
jgi:hypothetical protein